MNTNALEMNRRTAWTWMVVRLALVLLGILALASCGSAARVGALVTESQSVEQGEAEAVRVDIDFGAGILDLTGGAEKLLEADFAYNVTRLAPQVEYTEGTLVVRQPGANGVPDWRGLTGFRNEWELRLCDEVPMELRVKLGAGTSDLQLAGLSLTGLDVNLGAGDHALDLSGDWARDLDVTIDAGAARLRVRLPRDVGVRVEIDDGPHTVEAAGLTQVENVYTNAAYGVSEVTLRVDLEVGIGQIDLEVEEAE